ncbi:MAG: hypothetical protein ACRDQ4_26930 [Pseudonocardiaceae bacterium]
MAKSLQPPPADPDLEPSVETATKLITEIGTGLKRLKWFLWHGNVFRALQTVADIIADLEILHPDGEPTKRDRCVVRSRGQARSLIPVGQIAKASSSKAVRTRRFATSSVPSS